MRFDVVRAQALVPSGEGCDGAKQELVEVVDFLKNTSRLSVWADLQFSVLRCTVLRWSCVSEVLRPGCQDSKGCFVGGPSRYWKDPARQSCRGRG